MQPLLDWLKATGMRRVLWTTDFDETFMDSHANPGAITAPPGVADSCRDIDNTAGGGFYVVTGRDIGSLDRILQGVTVKASGEYHSMTRFDISQPPVDRVPRPQWHLIDHEIDAIASPHPDILVRKKPFMRTIKFGSVPALLNDPQAVEDMRARFDALLVKLTGLTGQALVNIDGGAVFDLAPAGGDKGSAIRDIFAHAAAGYKGAEPLVPLYFGDSPGDLPAALEVQRLGGKFVAVGSHPKVIQAADFRLATTAECRAVMAMAPKL